MSPQPPPSDPVWAGNSPSDGQIYGCVDNAGGELGFGAFFVATGQAPALIDPAVLAQRALGQLQLATPNVHTAPQPPDKTYVGLDTWLWMDAAQWDGLELTVTAGPTAVTVTAEPVAAAWDLTTGSRTCYSPGRAWVKGMSEMERTDCSYAFDRVSSGESDGTFDINATLTYQVDWTCAGACLSGGGTLGEVAGPAGGSQIRVGERQSVVIG